MSVRRLDPVQPNGFAFSRANVTWAKKQIRKYPEGKQASAIIPLLWRAQEQNDGWLPEPAIRHVADMLEMPYIRALEVATFYTMFNLSPVGKFYVQLCGTTPCMLCGSGELIEVCKRVIGPESTVTKDGTFSWLEVECLGACTNAPMVQINKDYYEDLTAESFEKILKDLAAGKKVKPGPQNGRHTSEPLGGPTTLTDESLYNGKAKKARATGKSNTADIADTDKGTDRKEPGQKGNYGSSSAPSSLKQPALMEEAPDGGGDDLKQISGVGPKLEGILHDLGVYTFKQISAWKKAEIAWVDERLKFKGRIERDDWVKQAKALAKGGKS